MSVKRFDKLKSKMEFVSHIMVIAGLIFAIYQYTQMRYQERVKETLSYEKRLNDGEFLKAKTEIKEAWMNQKSFIKELQKRGFKSKKDKEKIIEKLSDFIIEKNRLQEKIDLLTDFYDSLYTCVKEDICDKKTAVSFFSPYAKRFYELHLSYIKGRKEYIKEYAKGLEKLIKG